MTSNGFLFILWWCPFIMWKKWPTLQSMTHWAHCQCQPPPSTPPPPTPTPNKWSYNTVCIVKGYFKSRRPLRTNFLLLPHSRGYPKTISWLIYIAKLNVFKIYHLLFSVCSSEIVVLSSKEGLNTLKNYTQFKGIVSFKKRKPYNTADGAYFRRVSSAAGTS